jgi:hypothetical protein
MVSDNGEPKANGENLAIRRYYSLRTGKHPLGSKLDLVMLLKLFFKIYSEFERNGYFQEAFGYYCVDADYVAGSLGEDVGAYFLIKLRKDNIWPISESYQNYTEEDLFDVIEFLNDYVSKPIEGYHHTYGNCGWHYNTFDRRSGQREFGSRINEILEDYGDGYELSQQGEIRTLAIPGTEMLFEIEQTEYDRENVNSRVMSAISVFRRYRSSLEDKRNAVKMLVDVLEFLRPKLKDVLNKADERELFQIANSFGIRHHSEKQKTEYDQVIWLDWMFYYYLATINATVRLITKNKQQKT